MSSPVTFMDLYDHDIEVKDNNNVGDKNALNKSQDVLRPWMSDSSYPETGSYYSKSETGCLL